MIHSIIQKNRKEKTASTEFYQERFSIFLKREIVLLNHLKTTFDKVCKFFTF